MNRAPLGGFVANAFTVGNMLCGYLAILNAFEHQAEFACWMILLAAFLDTLDGRIARWSGTSSRFGVELDSFADFMSFGIAPAILLYTQGVFSFGKWGAIVGMVYVMCASFRLARFNVAATLGDKNYFTGMPSPAAALTLVGYVLFCYDIWGEIMFPKIITGIVILSAWLMISNVRYAVMPKLSWSPRNRLKMLVVTAVVVLMFIDAKRFLFPLIGAYAASGVIGGMFRGVKRRIVPRVKAA